VSTVTSVTKLEKLINSWKRMSQIDREKLAETAKDEWVPPGPLRHMWGILNK